MKKVMIAVLATALCTGAVFAQKAVPKVTMQKEQKAEQKESVAEKKKVTVKHHQAEYTTATKTPDKVKAGPAQVK